ncbi:hypothetical protein ACO9S2_14335 [Nitrospira sp. NS4]|uniref:hypothetical protein n=1 Tax=Nitrospira sp. NS4 TaxID=3414498 RepID=UPI003C306564
MKRGTVRLSLTMVWLFTGLCLSPDSHAAVEVLPEASMTVDGLMIADRAAIATQPVVQELLAAFGRAESAVQRQDLDALLKFYAEAYNYHGLKRADVRRIWGEVFEHYTGLSSTHLFSDIKVLRSGSQLRAEVTCTGGLYGAERKGGQRITLDSWFREVHFLVHEDGAWRFLGNAGQAPGTAPFTSSPHHPLF